MALPLTGLVATSPSAEPRAADRTSAALPSDGPPAASPTVRPSARKPAPAPAPAKPRATPAPPTGAGVGAAPARGPIPARGSGRFRTSAVEGPVVGEKGRLMRYTVRVERGLPLDTDTVARDVQRILSDDRSWTGTKSWRLQLVTKADRADFSVLVATPATTDAYCLPLRTWGRLSCQDGPRAVLNARRWAYGAETYGKDLAGYRTYLVNHEVGHVLGRGHVGCPKKGARAPVMVQQTKSLQGCRPNPWPLPWR